MIEYGETDGSGVVDLGDGLSAITREYVKIRIPIDLPGGGDWANVQRQVYCEMNFGPSILYVLDNPEYDVFVLLSGGARWVAKVAEETLLILQRREKNE